MDVVTELQSEIENLNEAFVSVFEEVSQSHAPPDVPKPPPDVDPNKYYQEYWKRRKAEEPFKTLGLKESSEQAFNELDRWKAHGENIVAITQKIDDMLENPLFNKSEVELDNELDSLKKEAAKTSRKWMLVPGHF